MRTLAAVLLLAASPLAAQYLGPPAQDIQEAQRMLSEFQKLLDPAFMRVRDQTETLNLITRVERLLDDYEALEGIDRSIEAIDEFFRKRDEQEGYPRELRNVVLSVRRWLEDARLAPQPDIPTLRERIHHEVTHPLQKTALANARTLQSLTNAFEPALRRINVLVTGSLGAAEGATAPSRKR